MLCACRHSSPLGGSTLMTSAPKSDRITAALGPAMKLARSTTFSPEKILSLAISCPFPNRRVRAASPTAELRCTFLEESGGAFLLVFGGGANAEVGSLQCKAFALAGLQPLVRRLQGELHSDRRIGHDLLQNRLGTVNQAGCRNDLVDETDAIGLLRGNRLAGQDQLQRAALSHQPRQALRAAATGQQAQLDFGLPKSGVLRCDPHRASHCRLTAAAKGKSVDRRDH